MGISSINTTVIGDQFNREQHKMEFVCNESKYLIESLVVNKVPSSIDLKNDSYQCEPQKELVDSSRISSDANDTFHMDYNIETRVARVCRKIIYPFTTEMKKAHVASENITSMMDPSNKKVHGRMAHL